MQQNLSAPSSGEESAIKYYREPPYTAGPLTDLALVQPYWTLHAPYNLLLAVLVKWVRQGRLKVNPEKGGFFDAAPLFRVQFKVDSPPRDSRENNLWDLLSGTGRGPLDTTSKETLAAYWHTPLFGEGIVTQQGNYWYQETLLDSRQRLVEQRFLGPQAARQKGAVSMEQLTPEGLSLFVHIKEFQNYLLNFAELNEPGRHEYHQLDELMEWAAFLGIYQPVQKQLFIHSKAYKKNRENRRPAWRWLNQLAQKQIAP